MNKQNAVSQSSILEELVRVKKIRFKEYEERRHRPVITYDILQRKANFEEFKAVYEDCNYRKSCPSLESGPYMVHKTRSGSLCRFPRLKKEPQYIDTVNIELPVHYGADRAVQIIENKIKPKTTKRPTVNREVITENSNHKRPTRSRTLIGPKPNSKKSVSFVDKLNTIKEITYMEQECNTYDLDMEIKEIQKQFRNKKDKVHKVIPKPVPVIKPVKKKPANDKIMDALSNINKKLQKMQEKYFNTTKFHFKNMNDCCTQMGNVEVIYENIKYPEENKGDGEAELDYKNNCNNICANASIKQTRKQKKGIFPEFPQIDDTLREIENHLENIVNTDKVNSFCEKDVVSPTIGTIEKINTTCNGGNLMELMKTANIPLQESLTEEILRLQQENNSNKLNTIKKQIDEVEGLCDRLSEIANDEILDIPSVSTIVTTIPEDDESIHKRHVSTSHVKTPAMIDFIEGPDLQASIKRSNYLSKEFSNVSEYSSNPMIKIFSENKSAIWKDRFKQAKKQNEDYSIESVTKMIDKLKYTLENSIYEPVT